MTDTILRLDPKGTPRVADSDEKIPSLASTGRPNTGFTWFKEFHFCKEGAVALGIIIDNRLIGYFHSGGLYLAEDVELDADGSVCLGGIGKAMYGSACTLYGKRTLQATADGDMLVQYQLEGQFDDAGLANVKKILLRSRTNAPSVWVGKVRYGSEEPPEHQLDVTGEVNADGFRAGGTAGVTQVIFLPKATPEGTEGSLTITGGIVTGYTPPT